MSGKIEAFVATALAVTCIAVTAIVAYGDVKKEEIKAQTESARLAETDKRLQIIDKMYCSLGK